MRASKTVFWRHKDNYIKGWLDVISFFLQKMTSPYLQCTFKGSVQRYIIRVENRLKQYVLINCITVSFYSYFILKRRSKKSNSAPWQKFIKSDWMLSIYYANDGSRSWNFSVLSCPQVTVQRLTKIIARPCLAC